MKSSPVERAYVIAEIGFNHNGKISTAKKLVKRCAKAGADCVKFQLFKTEKLLSSKLLDEIFPIFKKHELSNDNYLELVEIARKCKIEIAASIFDPKTLDWYCRNTDPPFIKIASGDITYKRLLKKCCNYDVPVILSTAAANREEIQRAINWLNGKKHIYLLHCTPEYPTAEENLNLARMKDLKKEFKLPVGFSDHSTSLTAPLEAAGEGSYIWERHVTLHRGMEGPEHSFSLPADDFEQVINKMSNEPGPSHKTKGGGLERTNLDPDYRTDARRALIAGQDISAGEKLNKNKIIELRPNRGISAARIDEISIHRAVRNFKTGELIEI